MLNLLGVDYIDVGLIHYCDSLSDWQNILDKGGLDYAETLKNAGKIGHIGLSSHNPVVARKAVETGKIEVLMFSVNPCYDLQPADENVEKIWAAEAYDHSLLNMDPEREKLYELCEEKGVGITVMKAFGGGDLLDASLSPAAVALTPAQCIGYALSRPRPPRFAVVRAVWSSSGKVPAMHRFPRKNEIMPRPLPVSLILAGRGTACTAIIACPARKKSILLM